MDEVSSEYQNEGNSAGDGVAEPLVFDAEIPKTSDQPQNDYGKNHGSSEENEEGSVIHRGESLDSDHFGTHRIVELRVELEWPRQVRLVNLADLP